MSEAKPPQQDIAALAKGGRTNFLGFLLRLMARMPFLFIASRLYGAPAMGRFASALVMVEFAGMLSTLGQKRGLAQRLAENDEHPANVVGDAVLLAMSVALGMGALIFLFPQSMYPSGNFTPTDTLLVLAIPGIALGDLALAALAYRFDVATTVRARSVVEPWTLSLAAGGLYFLLPASGLILAYLASVWAATSVALFVLLRSYGLPQAWKPRPALLWQIARRNIPLAGADAVEWGTRKLDVFILRFFVGEAAVGIYYFAQQIASLPQKLKTSFEPVLGPVITRSVKDKDYAAIAKQVCQVGFWIGAAQIGIAMALGIPGEGLMGLGGPAFVSGTAALVFLLIAEVVASKAVVSEAALVYLARMRNLWISLGTIAFQAVLTTTLIVAARNAGLGPMYVAAAASLALAIALGLSSAVKSRVLSRILGRSISNWRWGLAWAIVPALAAGVATKWLPEWAQLSLGIPLILGIYCYMLWVRAFGPEDRMLFRKQQAA
ncbi:MAG: lipopolysaccharide biosynthesis protein [Novosphingobium sp.]|nr:lipopolysaccharide biosynthesis protein [Novosphingobium sp.]